MINGATMLDASAKAPSPDRGYARRVDAGCHVHPEITAALIHASSRPDVRGLPLCDALIRYRRPTGSLITVCAPPPSNNSASWCPLCQEGARSHLILGHACE